MAAAAQDNTSIAGSSGGEGRHPALIAAVAGRAVEPRSVEGLVVWSDRWVPNVRRRDVVPRKRLSMNILAHLNVTLRLLWG